MWAAPAYGGGSGGERRDSRIVGSIRIKADPNFAKVYIDNALVGEVQDFNNLSNNLELDRGTYLIELRADGYETVSQEVTVVAGKTKTVRLSMKKKK